MSHCFNESLASIICSAVLVGYIWHFCLCIVGLQRGEKQQKTKSWFFLKNSPSRGLLKKGLCENLVLVAFV